MKSDNNILSHKYASSNSRYIGIYEGKSDVEDICIYERKTLSTLKKGERCVLLVIFETGVNGKQMSLGIVGRVK